MNIKTNPSMLIPKITRRLRLYKNRAVVLRRKLFHRPQLFEENYHLDDTTQVMLYTDRSDLFPNYQPRIALTLPDNPATPRSKIKVSLIATVRNEQSNVNAWGESLRRQTRLPDEIIITDAGSTDETVNLLKHLSAQIPVPFQIISEPGANIARGRNVAIEHTSYDVIAATDFGCRLHPDWLEKLVTPFEIDPKIQVVAGMYHVIDPEGGPRNPWWSNKAVINPQTFLPSGRSIAFTKEAWQAAGGYPEWLTLTGEDTYFDLELKRTCRWLAFSPEALVDWTAPSSISEYWKKLYRWSIGDGETGMFGSAYWYASIVSSLTLLGLAGGLLLILLGAVFNLPILLATGGLGWGTVIFRAIHTGRKAGYTTQEVVLVSGILAAQAMGYIKGAFRRTDITKRRLKTAQNIYFLLAVIPIDDTGGGARSTQIALELLRRTGSVVVYVNKYPKAESVELNLKIRHPNLFTIPANAFSVENFCAQYDLDLSKYRVGVVIEMPHPDWMDIIDVLQKQGASILYELIDEWDSRLGEGWYSKEIEIATIQKANALIATAPVLKTHLEEIAQRPAHLLPNAVNLRLFNSAKNYPVPADLPTSKPIITYIGALYGNWFDWELLTRIAQENTQTSVMVIGDYRGQCPQALPNLHFLGLKAQASLPAYLAHTTVAIIPWKVNEITLATSPLKLYEYLAMKVPVVVPNLPLLQNIPGVYLSEDQTAFLANIQVATNQPIDEAELDAFIQQNSWEARVSQLIQLMGFHNPGLS